jgi:hypothetical protein
MGAHHRGEPSEYLPTNLSWKLEMVRIVQSINVGRRYSEKTVEVAGKLASENHIKKSAALDQQEQIQRGHENSHGMQQVSVRADIDIGRVDI